MGRAVSHQMLPIDDVALTVALLHGWARDPEHTALVSGVCVYFVFVSDSVP